MPKRKLLKSCPFCGGAPEIIRANRYPKWEVPIMKAVPCWMVYCVNPDCIIYKARDAYYKTEEDAIEAWNRRAENEPSL